MAPTKFHRNVFVVIKYVLNEEQITIVVTYNKYIENTANKWHQPNSTRKLSLKVTKEQMIIVLKKIIYPHIENTANKWHQPKLTPRNQLLQLHYKICNEVPATNTQPTEMKTQIETMYQLQTYIHHQKQKHNTPKRKQKMKGN